MRIPCIRKGDDRTPLAWWEWPLIPLVIPAVMAVVMVVGVALIPVEIAWRLRILVGDIRLRRRLAATGRFIAWPELVPKLQAGEGTLVIESRFISLPDRAWWVERDLIGAAPCPLPVNGGEPAAASRDSVQTYACECVRLVDPHTGAAMLTRVSVKDVAAAFPNARVIRLINWDDKPSVFDESANRHG